jgi:UDP-GlcNAc:undecaprenyl-phosphate/decaprenyl-phosphate GlcNAc-1-phosphate transferase
MDFSSTTSYLYALFNRLPAFIQNTEYAKYLEYWPIFLIGLVVSLLLTPIIGRIARKNNITYVPKKGRGEKDFDNPLKALHEGITPSLGGLAITIPAFFAILIFFRLDSFTIPIVVSLFVLIVGATLDDIFNLPAKVQFLYQSIAAGIIAFSILSISSIPFFNIDLNMFSFDFTLLGIQQSLAIPGDIFLFLWILVCINAVKWTAGSPGIIEANSLVIFSLIFIIAIRDSSVFSSTVSVLIAGGLFIFLIFAFPPQKIMTGSAGKSVYGFLICILALVADAKISTTVMLLILPLIDFVYVIIKRYITYRPKNIGELLKLSGPDHLHHQLMKLDLSRSQLVLIEMSATLFLGSFAILTTGALRYFTLTLALALGIGFIVYINIRASKKKEDEEKRKSPESKYSY